MTRHNSSGTNQVEPRCRKALMRETTGLCQPLPIDLSTYRKHHNPAPPSREVHALAC